MKDRQPVKTFIIYARKDEELKNDLLGHLSSLVSSGFIAPWHDALILGGEAWHNVILVELAKAELVLVLVSADSLRSKFINETELPMALKQRTDGKTAVVPIILRPCLWEDNPILSGMQGLPKNMKPVKSYADSDVAWTEVAAGIKNIILDIRRKSATVEIPISQPIPDRPIMPFSTRWAVGIGIGLLGLLLIWFLVHKCSGAEQTGMAQNQPVQEQLVKNQANEHIDTVKDKKTEDSNSPAILPKTFGGKKGEPTEALPESKHDGPAPVESKHDSHKSGLDMVLVQGGTFLMGDDQSRFTVDKPAHQVTVRSFKIGKYEVTQDDWFKIMRTNPSQNKCAQCPVERVSWPEVQEFILKLNEDQQPSKKYRLPTEAEWEFAARAGKSREFVYVGGNDLDMLAWYDGNSNGKSHPVGLKEGNQLGLYDMSGNVCEWCQDNWYSNYDGAPSDGSAWIQIGAPTRVFRGGCWFRNYSCEVSARHWDYVWSKFELVGFRLAQD